MKERMRTSSYFRVRVYLGLVSVVMLTLEAAQAGSATWKVSPVSGFWNDTNNWTPATVPQGTDTATFGVSSITSISESLGFGSLGAYQFNSGASAYTITYYPSITFEINGTGVTNDSGVSQIFSIPASNQFRDPVYTIVSFLNNATAGSLTQWTVRASASGAYNNGELLFNNTSSAGGAAIFVNAGGSDIGGEDGDGFGGVLDFLDSSTADNANITVVGGPAGVDFGSPPDIFFTGTSTAANATINGQGGTIDGAFGAQIQFLNTATAATATITNDAGMVSGARGSKTTFDNSAKAANSVLIANGGTGLPGSIFFLAAATGDSASVKLFGDGTLDISEHDSSGMTLGSLEGDGLVYLGTRRLTVGRNRVNTTFTGLIQEGGAGGGTGGSFAKVGLGSLVLTNANTYTGDTAVNGGTFTVSNTTGSGTGTGPVQVNAGTLGGKGTIAGAVTVGADTIDRPHLAPASGSQTPATLTIQSTLTFKSQGGYNYLLRAKGHRALADRVNANGVTIDSGATFSLLGQVQGTLQTGTVFTAINNTSVSPISGTFVNLPDGGIISVNDNNLQASYTGGTGNDLTLTVVP
jgi:autotransporter-associated beta strand protein